jgi:uncharacterized protein YjaZ
VRSGEDGVVRTDEWLKKDLNQPILICKRLLNDFQEKHPEPIYEYLRNFGMYRPGISSQQQFQKLQEIDVWNKIEKIYQKYKKKWDGPDLPIYIFPFNDQVKNPERSEAKAGVSFKDKMFLFLSPLNDEKEYEALFVHEYHHVCRIYQQKKSISDYTLLDSIVLEGLAEHMVEKYCGEEYIAKWCRYYSRDKLEDFWEEYILKYKDSRKGEAIHERVLYGLGRLPVLLGYAAGYYIIENYKNENHFSTKATFILPTESFIDS